MENGIGRVLEIVQSIITALSPILLGFVTYMVERNRRDTEANRKETQKIRELREEMDRERAEQMQQRDDKIDKTLTELSEKIDKSQDAIEKLAESSTRQQVEIDRVCQTQELNMRCTRSLADVMTALAEGMRDQQLDGNITTAVKRYRATEDEVVSSLYKSHLTK